MKEVMDLLHENYTKDITRATSTIAELRRIAIDLKIERDRLLYALDAVPCTCFAGAIPGQDDHTSSCPKDVVRKALATAKGKVTT